MVGLEKLWIGLNEFEQNIKCCNIPKYSDTQKIWCNYQKI